jgi:hypothetical protein
LLIAERLPKVLAWVMKRAGRDNRKSETVTEKTPRQIVDAIGWRWSKPHRRFAERGH